MRPAPAWRCEPFVNVAARFQTPGAGNSIGTAYAPGRGLRGDRSCVWSYAVNECQVAGKGPSALPAVSFAIQTWGDPPLRSPPRASTGPKAMRFGPGFMGGPSAPVPSTESLVLPERRSSIDPVAVPPRRPPPLPHATPIRPTPIAARNCRLVDRAPRIVSPWVTAMEGAVLPCLPWALSCGLPNSGPILSCLFPHPKGARLACRIEHQSGSRRGREGDRHDRVGIGCGLDDVRGPAGVTGQRGRAGKSGDLQGAVGRACAGGKRR